MIIDYEEGYECDREEVLDKVLRAISAVEWWLSVMGGGQTACG